ncbi:MAG: hypothetical protein PVI26_10570 [Chitinispirillia bacterium]|jgi:hypothetical protein
MPIFPAVKGGDMMVGVDIHKVYGVPAHPYNGIITIHHTPKFPMCNVTVNSMPACTIGASSVTPHVPQGTPIDPSNFLYGKKDRVNTKMMQELIALICKPFPMLRLWELQMYWLVLPMLI